jgi:predicted RNA-binding protein associated with RNAse of E/G family
VKRTLTVYKLDEAGNEVWQYPATVLEEDARSVRLEAIFNRDRVDLGFVAFKRGDRFIETFYSDRYYNVFAVYRSQDGPFQGWYCNVCRPAQITTASVRCEDLALDVWVTPAGASTVLDEDEFAALNIPADERQRARAALAQLLDLAAKQQLPR